MEVLAVGVDPEQPRLPATRPSCNDATECNVGSTSAANHQRALRYPFAPRYPTITMSLSTMCTPSPPLSPRLSIMYTAHLRGVFCFCQVEQVQPRQSPLPPLLNFSNTRCTEYTPPRGISLSPGSAASAPGSKRRRKAHTAPPVASPETCTRRCLRRNGPSRGWRDAAPPDHLFLAWGIGRRESMMHEKQQSRHEPPGMRGDGEANVRKRPR